MNEAEWWACSDLEPMLEFLRRKASDRKLRLFAVACCRRAWQSLSTSTKGSVEATDRFIEGQAGMQEFLVEVVALAAQAPEKERDLLQGLAYQPGSIWSPDHVTAVRTVSAACVKGNGLAVVDMRRRDQASLLRDIFGNPFRRAVVEATWLTPTVTDLATTIYDDRAFDRMPILADALEEAGCDDKDVLEHCRGPGPHCRGCWVVDLILGKE
jgi:hypothetical protein